MAENVHKKVAVLCCDAPTLLTLRLDLLRDFMRAGLETTVLAPADPKTERALLAEGLSFIPVPLDRNGTKVSADIKAARAVKKVLQALQPDLLFCFHAKAVVYGLPAAKVAKVPARFALINGLGSVLMHRGTDLRGKLLRRLLLFQYRYALKRARTVFFQNPDNAKLFVDGGIVDPDKLRILNGSGVNLENFLPTPLPNEKRFLFVGRFLADKGLPEFLEAARRLTREGLPATFAMAGYYDSNPSAMQPEDVEPYIRDGSVQFLGFLKDIRPALCDCYAFVLPSHHEGTPRSALEAMATGRAIITTDAPGCRETVRDGRNGFLLPVGNVDALADAMRKLAGDRELAKRMGKRSREYAQERFDVREVNRVILEELLGT
ncbi:MAG: glycosyltransferase family 4 protein [Clostridiales bacterium]|nr:glycosyltransferase family 4 protein [Clostridiales bacterium]